MSLIRDVERRRADRLRVLYHLYSRPDGETGTMDAHQACAMLGIERGELSEVCEHLSALGLVHWLPTGEGTGQIEISMAGTDLLSAAEEDPQHRSHGFAALLDQGLRQVEPLGRDLEDRDGAEREILALHWIYSLSAGSVHGEVHRLDLSALMGLDDEALGDFVLSLEMDDFVRYDSVADTLSLTISAIVLVESVLWRGTSRVAGYPSAVEIGVVDEEEIPPQRR